MLTKISPSELTDQLRADKHILPDQQIHMCTCLCTYFCRLSLNIYTYTHICRLYIENFQDRSFVLHRLSQVCWRDRGTNAAKLSAVWKYFTFINESWIHSSLRWLRQSCTGAANTALRNLEKRNVEHSSRPKKSEGNWIHHWLLFVAAVNV